ncbi:MgtC/SapB family protein [Paraburkholderia sp. MMS20-SJTR3]|uniref:Protein MgtC n=1 Tax=Paraburkholderia sejongensis TaxID=2886946 RepID=A0ABS8JZT0_9BURK|nr:MgtC/SapB family protein [Paraburkholderia sp. MMS20-SJTR3]MCC8395405.1 MgtC/SapB family protein [Paraburkholderia sp. MMS20-SJTR3]
MHLDIIFDLLAAVALGALIGVERQWRQRFTGIATHALVALGAATFTTLPFLLGAQGDVVRMAAPVVSGIGFLGAGVIIRDGLSVRGLSTAATVWGTGAVGVIAGSGFLGTALIATLLIVLCNVTLPPLARLIYRHAPVDSSGERYYIIEVVTQSQQEALIRATLLQRLDANGLSLQSLESHALKSSAQVEVNAVVFAPQQSDEQLEVLVGELALAPYVSAVSWSVSDGPQ